MSELAIQHHSYEDWHEGAPSPFLTDRESAELTAISVMGPLAAMAFSEPQPGLRPASEVTRSEVPDTIGETVDGFPAEELLVAIRRQENISRAALMFAARKN